MNGPGEMRKERKFSRLKDSEKEQHHDSGIIMEINIERLQTTQHGVRVNI
jgi:hypothetical protein